MKPTPKQRVLKRWSDAMCRVTWALARWSSPKWQLLRGEFFEIAPYGINSMSAIGTGPTPAAAWRDAMRRMK